jgi:RimJ/RimL family protein N-acetyltransferase
MSWPPTLRSEHVVLRPMDERDREPIFAVLSSDPEISRWTRIPWPYERSHLDQFFSLVGGWHSRRTDAVWAVTAPDSDEALGCIGAHRIGGASRARSGFLPDEPGYWLRESARGRGLMAIALRLVCDWLLDEVGRPEVNIQVKVGNVASRTTAERVGFEFTGTVLASDIDDDPFPADHDRFVLRR